jgi:hypothetical protein
MGGSMGSLAPNITRRLSETIPTVLIDATNWWLAEVLWFGRRADSAEAVCDANHHKI